MCLFFDNAEIKMKVLLFKRLRRWKLPQITLLLSLFKQSRKHFDETLRNENPSCHKTDFIGSLFSSLNYDIQIGEKNCNARKISFYNLYLVVFFSFLVVGSGNCHVKTKFYLKRTPVYILFYEQDLKIQLMAKRRRIISFIIFKLLWR